MCVEVVKNNTEREEKEREREKRKKKGRKILIIDEF